MSESTAEPRLTVLMPAYQSVDYIGSAVDSILAQTYLDFQLLILDDGSTDGTLEALDRQRRDPRVHVVQLQHGGMAAALNHGLLLTGSEYIARMDSDDLSEPQRFAAQIQYLDRHPEAMVVGTASRIIDPAGRTIRTEATLTDDADLRRLLRIASPFTHGSVMFRRRAVVELGGYDAAYWPAEDYDLWCRIGRGFANLPAVLYSYREHPGGSSRIEQQEQAERIASRLQEREPLPALPFRQLLRSLVVHRRRTRWYLSLQRAIRRGASTTRR